MEADRIIVRVLEGTRRRTEARRVLGVAILMEDAIEMGRGLEQEDQKYR